MEYDSGVIGDGGGWLRQDVSRTLFIGGSDIDGSSRIDILAVIRCTERKGYRLILTDMYLDYGCRVYVDESGKLGKNDEAG
ncbi:hypothetical protein Tco_0955794 [Tanacetum coccineum]|uniref:Uncharacterized protein n=1 Tax=Tanacetum coccineum TaxID=301880 RepID=A0ABQ5E8B2_9ASTR